MDLPRFLVLISMKHNFYVRACYVPGVSNAIADALSRFQDARLRGQTCILRQPVTLGVLLAIQPKLCTRLGEQDFSMIWALFTLAFSGCFRCSEFTYQGTFTFRPQFDLTAHYVSFHPSLACPQHMSIFLKASKTHAFHQGQVGIRSHCYTQLFF